MCSQMARLPSFLWALGIDEKDQGLVWTGLEKWQSDAQGLHDWIHYNGGRRGTKKAQTGREPEQRPGDWWPWPGLTVSSGGPLYSHPVFTHPASPCLPDASSLPGSLSQSSCSQTQGQVPARWQLVLHGNTLAGTRLRWMNHQRSYGRKWQKASPELLKQRWNSSVQVRV